MRHFFKPSRPACPPAAPTDRSVYGVLVFQTRTAAVRYCLDVGDALAEAPRGAAAEDDHRATVWLAADMKTGFFEVYACERALAAAHSAGIDAVVAARVPSHAIPAARCLVVGDTARLLAQ